MLTNIFFFVLVQSINIIDAQGDCSYYQYIESDQTYYVYSPNYPSKYQGENHCSWLAKSDKIIQVNCSVDMPASKDCVNDVMWLDTQGPNAHKYCGSGKTSKHTGDEILITFNSVPNTKGGTFVCELKSTGESNCRCGRKNPAKIAGGESTRVNEYPLMVGLLDVKKRELYCGATIINEYQVLTSAYCVEDRSFDTLGVLVGDHDLTKGDETNATKLFRVIDIAIHPGYRTNGDDIAVVTIGGEIKFNQQVGPACLPFEHSPDSFAGYFVDILGWGLLESAGAQATQLQKIEVSVVTNKYCREYHPNLKENEMCTFTEGKDACKFDEGGPVLWRNPSTKRLVLVGVLRRQGGCNKGLPTVITRVGAYIDWIVSVSPQEDPYCKEE